MATRNVRHFPVAAIAATLLALAIGSVPVVTMVALSAKLEAVK